MSAEFKMISVYQKTKDRLDALKLCKDESYNNEINRILDLLERLTEKGIEAQTMTQLQEISPLEMYDIVYKEAKRLGHLKKFLHDFGTKTEYAKRIGMEASA